MIIEIQIELGFVESQYAALSAPKCDKQNTDSIESYIEPDNQVWRVTQDAGFSCPQMDFHSLSAFSNKVKKGLDGFVFYEESTHHPGNIKD